MSNKFKNVLAFCILMGDKKVLTKSPDYILEKYERYCSTEYNDRDDYLWGLDNTNKSIFQEYLDTWDV